MQEKIKEVFREYFLVLIALALAIASGLWLLDIKEESRWRSPVEAVFIAAFLTIFVDPYLKKKLFLEANRDIFHLMLGFSLPDKIQQRLRKYLLDIEYYRDGMEVWAELVDKGAGLRLQITTESNIVLIKDTMYSQSIRFEEADKGNLEIMDATYISDETSIHRGARWSGPATPKDDPMTHVFHHEDVRIEADQHIRSDFKFDIAAEGKSHWDYVFGSTTANTIVHLSPSPGMEMFISTPFEWDPEEKNFFCNGVFTKNERFTIRWRPLSQGTAGRSHPVEA